MLGRIALAALLLLPAVAAQEGALVVAPSLSTLRASPGAGGSVFLDVSIACLGDEATVTLEPDAPEPVSVDLLPGFHVFPACRDGKAPDPRASEARVKLAGNATIGGRWPVVVHAKAYAQRALVGQVDATFEVVERTFAPTGPAPSASPPATTPAKPAPGFGALGALAAAAFAVAAKKR